MKTYSAGSLIILVFFFNSCDFSTKRSVTTIGELTIGVDEGVQPVVTREANEFMRLNEESKINVVVKTTKELIADLNNGELKTIVVGRDLTPEEEEIFKSNKIELKKNKFALDGIGVIVNPANPLRRLNFRELKEIFSGEVTDWEKFSGGSTPPFKGKIDVFIARKNASIHDIFKSKVMEGKDFSSGSKVCSTSAQMMSEIRSGRNAIGFISMSWITVSNDTLDESVKPLKIASVDSQTGSVGEYVGLHQAYIADKSYPLSTEVFILSSDFSMNVSVGFISFMLSYDGQRIVLKSGLVPVTQPVRIIQLN
ncbi:MAG: substrate-binding domain-containing protein [Ignavibacteria bacterium]|nr:substrate-binding domain-containing protein [Ignavibacteria bacterium]